MKVYTLRNQDTQENLLHPRIGLWYTKDLEEAKSMLESCCEYVRSLNMDTKAFVIVDAETNEVIE